MSLADVWSFAAEPPVEIALRTTFVRGFANVAAFETDAGLVLVDTGAKHVAPAIHAAVRARTAAPLHTVVFTHGHADHAFGMQPWLAEGASPRVVAHRAVVDRFRRYARTTGLNERINAVQFGVDRVEWPRPDVLPDVLFDDRLTLVVGGEAFELRHARGETDDATWLWAPSRGVLCTGDLFIGCAPNCGNPQKVQRYAEDWAEALEAMAALGAEVMLPGHGPAITGAAAVRAALVDTSAYLRAIVEQVLAGLNAGLRHDAIVASVRVPAELADKPYLAPLYDRPEFIARNVIRLHAGWWGGAPSELLPAPADARARAIADLAGGVDALVARARALAATDLPLACHLAEWATLADPTHRGAREAMRDVFRARAEGETSLMARSIFLAAVRAAEGE